MSPSKKPGIGLMIALGKPGATAPPRYKTPGNDMASPKPPISPDAEESPAHEATETPDMEAGEDYGSKLTADIDSVFADAGIDKNQGRQMASKLFSAVAKCLSGDSGDDPHAPGRDDMSAMDDMSNSNSEGY